MTMFVYCPPDHIKMHSTLTLPVGELGPEPIPTELPASRRPPAGDISVLIGLEISSLFRTLEEKITAF